MAAKTINLREAWAKWKRRVRVDLVHQIPLRGTAKVILGKICDLLGFNECCWPSIPWLACEAGCCERTVQNALARLKALNLIEISERWQAVTGRQQSNYLSIVWQTVGRMTKTAPLSVLARPARLAVSKPLKIFSAAPQLRGEGAIRGANVSPVAPGGCNQVAPLESNVRAIGTSNERHWAGDGDFQSVFNGSGSPSPKPTLPQPPGALHGERPAVESRRSETGGWPAPITLDTLKDRLLLTINFHYARRKGWVHEDDEARFKTLAASIVDRYEHPPPGRSRIRNVGATFTKCVKRKLWFGSAIHEDKAIGKPKREASYSPC